MSKNVALKIAISKNLSSKKISGRARRNIKHKPPMMLQAEEKFLRPPERLGADEK